MYQYGQSDKMSYYKLQYVSLNQAPVLAAPASVWPPSGQDLYYGPSSLGSPSGLLKSCQPHALHN